MPSLSLVVFAPHGPDQMCFVPSTTEDKNVVQKMRWKHGDIIASEFRKPRSGPHHRLAFGLLKFVFESQERFDNMEALRRWLTLHTTFVIEAVDHATGAVIRMPRSWSYDDMDEVEFSELHDQIEHAALHLFFPTETENWLREGVNFQAYQDGIMDFHDTSKYKARKAAEKQWLDRE